MMEFLSFLLGSVAVPIFLFFLGKINPNKTALIAVSLLEKIFADKELRNKVSNALGIRFILFGASLITAIEDKEKIMKEVEKILESASELLLIFSDKDKEG